MSASPCFQCFKAVFFLHFYPPHVSKVSRKERKCYFLSTICSVNSLFCSTTTLSSALTEAPFTTQTNVTIRFSVDTTLPATVNCFRPFTCLILLAVREYILGYGILPPPYLPAVLIWYFSFLYISVVNCDPLSSRYVRQSRPHVGRFGSTIG